MTSSPVKKMIVKMLHKIADDIDAGTCELNDEEASDLVEIISHRAMSKEEACSYLNLSRSRFDDLVREGRLPKGRKRKGFKEVYFYKDELDKAKVKN